MKKFYTFLILMFTVVVGHAQIVNIPDANFKAKLLAASSTATIAYDAAGTNIKIDTNNDGNIQLSEALTVYKLVVGDSSTIGTIIDMTGVESFTNLKTLSCLGNHITILNVTPLTNLESLDCSTNSLTALNVSSLSNLKYLYCSSNQLTTLDTSASTNLQILCCNTNSLTNLNINNCLELSDLKCYSNQLTSLDVSNRINLHYLSCDSNLITNLNITNCLGLVNMSCSANQLTTLDISNRPYLSELVCSHNLLTSLNITNDHALVSLFFADNQIQSINLDPFVNLTTISMGANPYSAPVNINTLVNLRNMELIGLSNPAVSPLTDSVMPSLINLNDLSTDGSSLGNMHYNLLPALTFLNCSNTGLTSLNTIPTTITQLVTEANQLTSIDLNAFTNLEIFAAYNNPITNVILGSHPALYYLEFGKSQLTNIDVSGLPALTSFYMQNCPLLTSCNVKNGLLTNFSFSNCPNLLYICANDTAISNIQTAITTNTASYNGNPNCHVNTYCSFVPGGTFYTIQGNSRYDSNNNGCDASDINIPNLNLTFTTGTITGNLIGDTTGSYHNDVQAGTHTFSPTLENPTYFTITPTTASVTFPTTASPFVQNFCITATGVHYDLEVSILPIYNARPGFDAKYKIIYKNIGTNTQSGSVSLAFDDSKTHLASAVPIITAQSSNNLSWNFSNLLPFESREILLTLHLNSTVSTPPLNIGDTLSYTATVVGAADETPINNTSPLNQIVVASHDPNDKTCLEGTTVSPSTVGQYVHYIVRFENTGTANAQNIVVKDMIDTTKYDINSLVPLSGSASYVTRITNTNKVEFIFQNINLPSEAGSNDGYVAFKIKTLPTLVVGDTFSNTANIYFDYNAPIVTNTATTTIAALGTQDFVFSNVFSLSPVPAENVLTITTKQNVVMSSLSIYNTLGQLVQVVTNPAEILDVSGLKTGSYFIKIVSDKGTASGKFVKE